MELNKELVELALKKCFNKEGKDIEELKFEFDKQEMNYEKFLLSKINYFSESMIKFIDLRYVNNLDIDSIAFILKQNIHSVKRIEYRIQQVFLRQQNYMQNAGTYYLIKCFAKKNIQKL